MLEWSFDRWNRTLTMNKALCSKTGHGAFPSPTMLIQAGTAKLQSECGLGYRAKTLIQLAEQVMPEPLHGAVTRPGCCIKQQTFAQCLQGTGSDHIWLLYFAMTCRTILHSSWQFVLHWPARPLLTRHVQAVF